MQDATGNWSLQDHSLQVAIWFKYTETHRNSMHKLTEPYPNTSGNSDNQLMEEMLHGPWEMFSTYLDNPSHYEIP